MDDSCQDFVDVCSKLLKRVRKKQAEPRQKRKEEKQPSSQAGNGAKRKRNQKRDGHVGSRGAAAQSVCTAAETVHEVLRGGPGFESGEAGRAERGLTAKEKVLQRMQEFKRASPPKIVHMDNDPDLDGDCSAPTPMTQKGEITERRWVFNTVCC